MYRWSTSSGFVIKVSLLPKWQACAPSLSSKKTPLRWMKRSSLCSATIVHWASFLGRPVSGRATQYSHAVPTQPRFFCDGTNSGKAHYIAIFARRLVRRPLLCQAVMHRHELINMECSSAT